VSNYKNMLADLEDEHTNEWAHAAVKKGQEPQPTDESQRHGPRRRRTRKVRSS
jgi:hypothetical protein